MKVIHESENSYILAWFRGEEVISSLSEFLERENIRASHFSGLGAAESLEIAFYNLDAKEYEKKSANYDVEILSLVGNSAMMDGRPIVHMHGVFAKRDFSAFGGHVFSIHVSGACELHVTRMSGIMKREYDEASGLNLLCELD
ncbi:MAG: DNA-binding protein [Candidatus Sungbacteria bacterium]|uniref:DNA-binding protein n=1 Tax=Candidatus Sungiibacteriota bacterium TaxID=2750080 RepID=A0A9D6LRE1_9BACT|nr:DNA-binding protein [Candidatus Sungbacteria bacterium]